MVRIPGTTFSDVDPPKPQAMPEEQFVGVLQSYIAFLESRGRSSVRNNAASSEGSQEDHLLWMCHEATAFMKAGYREKAMRWLGFIQGAFWAHGLRSVDEMKEDNR